MKTTLLLMLLLTLVSYGQMKREVVRDTSGKIVCFIDRGPQGNVVVRNSEGSLMGRMTQEKDSSGKVTTTYRPVPPVKKPKPKVDYSDLDIDTEDREGKPRQ